MRASSIVLSQFLPFGSVRWISSNPAATMRICSKPCVLSFMNFSPRSRYGSTVGFFEFRRRINAATDVLIGSGARPRLFGAAAALRVVTILQELDDELVRGRFSSPPSMRNTRNPVRVVRRLGSGTGPCFGRIEIKPAGGYLQRLRKVADRSLALIIGGQHAQKQDRQRLCAWWPQQPQVSTWVESFSLMVVGREPSSANNVWAWRRPVKSSTRRFLSPPALVTSPAKHFTVERVLDELDRAVAKQDIGPGGVKGVDAPVVVAVDCAWATWGRWCRRPTT